MKKHMKRMLALLLAIMMMTASGVFVSAAQSGKQEKKAVKKAEIVKVTCTAAGKLNISFKKNVGYEKTVKAVITDDKGNDIPASIAKKNKKLLSVNVKGIVKGKSYRLKLEGVVANGSCQAVEIVKTFIAKGMKTECKPEKVCVSKNKAKKNGINVQLKGKACYKSATVCVKDADGKTYAAKIVKKSKGNIHVAVTGLTRGKKYTMVVNGIKSCTEQNYSSITVTFTAK